MRDGMHKAFRHIPSWAQIVPVYAVIVVIVYTWTLMWFFWKVPSWLYFLNAGEILMQLAYTFATNFMESIVVLCGPLFLAIVLPSKWFRDVFVARGASLSIIGLAYMIFLANQFTDKDAYPSLLLKPATVLLAAVIIAVLVYFFGRIALLRKVLELIADRVTIFVYILTPLSMISLVIVAIRSVTG